MIFPVGIYHNIYEAVTFCAVFFMIFRKQISEHKSGGTPVKLPRNASVKRKLRVTCFVLTVIIVLTSEYRMRFSSAMRFFTNVNSSLFFSRNVQSSHEISLS